MSKNIFHHSNHSVCYGKKKNDLTSMFGEYEFRDMKSHINSMPNSIFEVIDFHKCGKMSSIVNQNSWKKLFFTSQVWFQTNKCCMYKYSVSCVCRLNDCFFFQIAYLSKKLKFEKKIFCVWVLYKCVFVFFAAMILMSRILYSECNIIALLVPHESSVPIVTHPPETSNSTLFTLSARHLVNMK